MLKKKIITDQSDESKSTNLPLVNFENVSLYYRKFFSFFDFLVKKKKWIFWALKDISFSIYEGDSLGVVGRNGSGKSTLALTSTKIYPPDKGKVSTTGRVQLLALGLGFQNQLSGRENVYISGSLLGLKISAIKHLMGEIEEFADIGAFIDEPVRTYSSGMRSRLAFAIATAIHPDVLILDEVLATGDNAFRKKAMERIENLHLLSRCAMIISHNPNQLKNFCNKALWLEKGRIVMQGEAGDVLTCYQEFCKDPDEWISENPEYFDFTGENRN